MTQLATIVFAKPPRKPTGTVVILAGEGIKLGALAKDIGAEAVVAKVAAVSDYKAKAMSVLDALAPRGADFDRLVVVGTGKTKELTEYDWLRLGGDVAGA